MRYCRIVNTRLVDVHADAILVTLRVEVRGHGLEIRGAVKAVIIRECLRDLRDLRDLADDKREHI